MLRSKRIIVSIEILIKRSSIDDREEKSVSAEVFFLKYIEEKRAYAH